MFNIKTESVKKLQKEKTRKQLQEENEALTAQVESLTAQVEEQADALIELAGMIDGEV